MLTYNVGLVFSNSFLMRNLRVVIALGSPLPISNRVVKPNSADGTANWWESMSLPSLNPNH